VVTEHAAVELASGGENVTALFQCCPWRFQLLVVDPFNLYLKTYIY